MAAGVQSLKSTMDAPAWMQTKTNLQGSTDAEVDMRMQSLNGPIYQAYGSESFDPKPRVSNTRAPPIQVQAHQLVFSSNESQTSYTSNYSESVEKKLSRKLNDGSVAHMLPSHLLEGFSNEEVHIISDIVSKVLKGELPKSAIAEVRLILHCRIHGAVWNSEQSISLRFY